MNSREACANAIGEDYAAMPDREYQPTRTGGVLVYTSENRYYFALKVGKTVPPRLVREFPDLPLNKVVGTTGDYLLSYGYIVYYFGE